MKNYWVLVASALVAFTFLFADRENAPSQAVNIDEARQRYLTALQILDIEERRLGGLNGNFNQKRRVSRAQADFADVEKLWDSALGDQDE